MTDDKDKALAYYRAATEKTAPPFVPARVKLPKAVTGDFPFNSVRAEAGEHECESNKWGAVTVLATNGTKLGVRPAEFDVIGWRPNARVVRREPQANRDDERRAEWAEEMRRDAFGERV